MAHPHWSPRSGAVHQWLTRWPGPLGSLDWQKGFLAGIFDAEGSYSVEPSGSTPDPGHHRLDHRLHGRAGVRRWWSRPASRANGLRAASGCAERAAGGAPVLPHDRLTAITRKRSIEGMAIGRATRRWVVASVEPLGLTAHVRHHTPGPATSSPNGVVSHNCFARRSHTYLDLDAGHDFDTKIVVKVNAPERGPAPSSRAPRWRGEHIAMGTNDRPLPARRGALHGSCRASWSPCSDAANPFSILTKGHPDPARRRPAGARRPRSPTWGWAVLRRVRRRGPVRGCWSRGRPARGAASRCAPAFTAGRGHARARC